MSAVKPIVHLDTAAAAVQRPRDGVLKVPHIPIRGRQYGPLVLKRRWRTFLLWSVAFAGLWALLAQNLSPAWNAFSLGMMIPGAGFLYAGTAVGMVLALLGLLALPASMITWFASGNVVNVAGTWIGIAALSAWYAATWSTQPLGQVATFTPYVAMGIVALWAIQNRLGFYRGRARARQHNAYIDAIKIPVLREIPAVQAAPEMSEHELAVAQSFYAKALQPLNQWEGFALDVEQWQLKATRYQLYSATTQIAHINYMHTPAFAGYARESMANLILKNLDKRIWNFWAWENLWGNLDPNPDPIRKDNIMITGFLSTHIGMFETLFGDRRFDREGALTWRWSDKRQFRYSYSQMIEAMMHNFGRYDFSWYPCEPNLLYSMCNINGFNALQFHDRLRGTRNWDKIAPRVERSFEEEFMHPDGRVVCLLFNRVGLQAPTLSSVIGESAGIPGMIAMWPEKAERLWHVMKRQFLKRNGDGSLRVEMVDFGWDHWDATAFAGNIATVMRAHEIRPLFLLLQAAVEMGDEEVVSPLSDLIDKKFGLGTSMAIKLGHSKAALRNFTLDGMPKAWQTGPMLEQAAFPDVLVARAVSDGQALDLVLRPGAGPKPVRLGFNRLAPGRRYAVSGDVSADVVADALGHGSIVVDLNGRTALNLTPRH